MIRKMSFIIDNIDELKEQEDMEFAVANIDFLSTSPNSHELVISEDVLRNCAPTVLGKWLVGKYNNWKQDVEGHENKETIFGIFPENQEIEFYEKNGYLVAKTKAVISKIYAQDFYEIFKRDNHRNVSVEMTVESDELNGQEIVKSFNIFGVTCLGKRINGSCPQATMEMIKFEEKAKDFYNSQFNTLNKLEKFSKERREKMTDGKNDYVSHPLNTSKDAVDVGDWNGEQSKKDLVKEKKYETIGKTICLDFQGGDRTQANCKYPVMNLKDGEWVYNAEGISSARGYSKDKDEKVYNKAISLQKKLGLYKNDEDKGDEKKMENKKFSQLEGREIYAKIIELMHKKLGKHYYLEEVYSDHIEVRDMNTKEIIKIPADIKLGKDDEDVHVEIDWDKMKKSVEQKQFAEKDKKMDDDEEDDDVDEDEKEGEEDVDKEDKKEKKEMKKKKMSSDGNVDPSAYAEMLKQEAARNANLVKEMEEKDNIIMNYEKELSELRKFKEDEEEKEKKMAVDKEMADVKECVDEKEFKDLKEEGMACKMSEIDGWKNKVKAIAFEKVKNGNVQTSNSIWRMSGISNDQKTSNGLWD